MGIDPTSSTFSMKLKGQCSRDARSHDLGLTPDILSAMPLPPSGNGRPWSPEERKAFMRLGLDGKYANKHLEENSHHKHSDNPFNFHATFALGFT